METVLIILVIVLLLLVLLLELRRQRTAPVDAMPAGAGMTAGRLPAELMAELERTSSQIEAVRAAQREELSAIRADLAQREDRVRKREDDLTKQLATLQAEHARLDRERASLTKRSTAIEAREQQVVNDLEKVAGLGVDEARSTLIARVEHSAKLAAVSRAREIEAEATRDAEQTARDIIVTTIQRLATQQTAESVVSTVELPNDDMKGRIIGREGRNIRHFEQVTGVNVMIDDTPGSVLLSCFDPVRRETARLALIDLVADGRIHPARIEESYEASKDKVLRTCQRAAEDALTELGIVDMDPVLVELVGSLRYRTSYGQNVLAHMLECAKIAGMIAAELGLDVASCRRAAFLHDIGKAIVHHGEASHALEGAEMARRHGESSAVVNAIASHHNEVPADTVEAVIAQTADAISGSRPGARRESLEAYVHRLERLEAIAGAHPGVEKVFAMQAGREVRVMVQPDRVDDASSYTLAHDIAREVESELTYPGSIRITVVRESRATELAH